MDPLKAAVRINFDETSVCFYQSEKRGWLVPQVRKRMRQGDSVTGDVKTSTLKTNFTHLAFICDDTTINKVMPQILIFKESLMPMAEYEAVKAAVPTHWLVLRQAKAWVNIGVMRKALQCLAANLDKWRATHEFLIMFDTFRAHINGSVLKAMGESGLFVAVIPANTTSMLQPLDVYAFAQYKRSLRLHSMVRRLSFPKEVNSWIRIVALLVKTTTEVLVRKDWEPAFRRLGLSGNQVTVSKNTRERLEINDLGNSLPNHFPSLAELKELFPTRAFIPIDELFQVHLSLNPPPEPPKKPDPKVEVTPPHVANPWFGRTRSTSHLLLVSPSPKPPSFISSGASSSTSPWIAKTPPPLPPKSSSP